MTILLLAGSCSSIISRFAIKPRRFTGMALSCARVLPCNDEGITRAATSIKAGELVAFPTETVYGLGADALQAESVKRIFQAKRRPATDPLIVHVHSYDQVSALFDFESPQGAVASTLISQLCASFWPGPLTIIYKATAVVPPEVTSGTGFVGVRSPRHPIARQLLERSGACIAAPSANRFGHVSPTTHNHVLADLGEEDISVLQDDPEETGGCDIGIESTVCRISPAGDAVSILRCGAVTPAALQAICGSNIPVTVADSGGILAEGPTPTSPPAEVQGAEKGSNAAVAPGQMVRHYAPDLPTMILRDSSSIPGAGTIAAMDAVLERVVQSARADLRKELSLSSLLVMDFGGELNALGLREGCAVYLDLSPSGDPAEACANVFRMLREAESHGSKLLGVRSILLPDLRPRAQQDDLVLALWERLHRSASGVFV